MFVAFGRPQLLDDRVVNQIGPARYRRQKPAAPAYGRKLPRFVSGRDQGSLDYPCAIPGPRQHGPSTKLLDLVISVLDCGYPFRAALCEYSELGGRGPRIDDKDAVTVVRHGFLPTHATLIAIPEFDSEVLACSELPLRGGAAGGGAAGNQ